eukprot:TRINITY_DN110860_c0_g1_i1.p1 TRINITY_DN110860_c0_g1~~TRINITY_DN110860_c0_g1_i1.p1  ORF type:complete len:304 (+),score=93.97 TRINITY_DN110860_c0_g1_i1:77-988(+)
MGPKKPPVEEPPEPDESAEPPPPAEGDETELETGLKLPLRPNDVGKLWSLGDYSAQSKLLTQLLGLEVAHPSAARRDIIGDFHIFNLSHAKTLCLTQRQGAVFHAIMTTILDMMAGWEGQQEEKSSSEGAPSGAAECFKEYQRLLLAHSVNDPPSRLAIFSGAEARRLADYASTTLFKHFLLYQFCARCERDVQTLRFSVELDRPAAPPELAHARPKRRHNDQQVSADVEGSGGAGEEKAAGAGGEDEPSEEDEIQRLVEEKLRETEARLEAKLAEREQSFQTNLAAKNASRRNSKASQGSKK